MAENKKQNQGKRVSAAAPAAPRKNQGEKRSILRASSPFMLREAYKQLRTNIAFSLPGSDAKCIGISSSERGDGKSTNSVNLAISFAEIGKKVILLDCDLRIPTVAAKMGVKVRPGLSDFLVGEAPFEEVIRRDVMGADVIPAGSIPPDATGLLASEQIEKLITKLREYYDYIIIDLPPVNIVADAAIMSRCIDGFALVVRNGVSKNRDIAEALRRLRMADAKVIGFIHNDVPVQGKRYYYRSYYKK